MFTHLFKLQCLSLNNVLVLILTCVLTNPIPTTAAPSQDLGTWRLNSLVPYELRGISFISPSDGWAVGFEGTTQGGTMQGSVLLHWDGAVWNRVTSPVNDPLFAVKMISSTDVWAVGQSGTRLHWDGISWSDFSCEYVNCVDLYSVDSTSSNDVWAVGSSSGTVPSGKIEHWDGSAWAESSLVGSYAFRSVSAVSESVAWSVGRYVVDVATSKMAFARWNGISWYAYYLSLGPRLTAVDMISSTEGWAVGNAEICQYQGTWECHSYGGFLSSLEMLSATDGWAVGGTNIIGGGTGMIKHWDGASWTMMDNPAEKYLTAIDMLSANEGWAVGSGGIILHYTNFKYVYLPIVTR